MSRSILFLLAFVLWFVGNWKLKPAPLKLTMMEIAPPVPVQLAASFGDRYLAANIGVWRSIVVGGGELPEYSLDALQKTQVDASWMNPAHEDNYYTASALLPWAGYVDATQVILERAIEARRSDPLPPFLYAFNQLNFRGDVDGAVAALLDAKKYTSESGTKMYFAELASRWKSRGDDPVFVLNALRGTAKQTNNNKLLGFLDKQSMRLNGLIELRLAVARFQELRGISPLSLDDLVVAHVLDSLPIDPSGLGYALRGGVVYLKTPQSNQRNLR